MDPGAVRIYNQPNPFCHSTTIHYELASPASVVLRLYDVSGQLIQTLVDKPESVGHKAVQWAGCDARGDRVAAGVYFYALETNTSVLAGRMIIVD